MILLSSFVPPTEFTISKVPAPPPVLIRIWRPTVIPWTSVVFQRIDGFYFLPIWTEDEGFVEVAESNSIVLLMQFSILLLSLCKGVVSERGSRQITEQLHPSLKVKVGKRNRIIPNTDIKLLVTTPTDWPRNNLSNWKIFTIYIYTETKWCCGTNSPPLARRLRLVNPWVLFIEEDVY
jgi:hypothetical protein